MKDVLERLDGSPGIDSVLVMNAEGIVVSAFPANDQDKHDRIAAFVSLVLVSIEKDAAALGLQPLRRLTLWATEGRVLVMPMEEFSLVVVADRNTDLSLALVEIAGLARGLVRRAKIEV